MSAVEISFFEQTLHQDHIYTNSSHLLNRLVDEDLFGDSNFMGAP